MDSEDQMYDEFEEYDDWYSDLFFASRHLNINPDGYFRSLLKSH